MKFIFNNIISQLIRVVDKQIAYDIVPLVKQTTDVKTGKLVPSNLIGHAIYEAKRVESSGSYNDFLTSKLMINAFYFMIISLIFYLFF